MTASPDWSVRPIDLRTDVALLAAFTCSDGSVYSDEVEQFIQQGAANWSRTDAQEDRRLLVLVNGAENVVGLGAHRLETFYETKPDQLGRRVEFIAIAVDFQGASDKTGKRYSDILLQAVLDDLLLREPANPITSAIIHRDNERSLEVFYRNDFTNMTSWLNEYVIVW